MDNPEIQPSGQEMKPIDLLTAQTTSLSDLVNIQRAQSSQITELKQQNAQLIQLIANQTKAMQTGTNNHVKIEDVNMPFGAMVGLMLKIAFASIPAAIILAILGFLVSTIFTACALGTLR